MKSLKEVADLIKDIKERFKGGGDEDSYYNLSATKKNSLDIGEH